MRGYLPISADHPAQISAPVVRAVFRRLSEPTDAQQFASHYQVRPAAPAPLAAGDVLPPATGEEAVVAARDHFGAVLQRDAVGGFDRLPVRRHDGRSVSAVRADALRAID